MKPEPFEIEKLHRDMAKLKAERDILRSCRGPVRGRNSPCYPRISEGSGRQLIGSTVPVKNRGPTPAPILIYINDGDAEAAVMHTKYF